MANNKVTTYEKLTEELKYLTEEEQAKFDYSWETLEKTIRETIDPLLY